MNKKRLLIVIVAALLIAAAVIVYAVNRNSTDTSGRPESGNTSSSAQDKTPKRQKPPVGETITVTGAMNCVPPDDENEVHTLMCAIGVKADDGKQYALNMEDPTAYGSLPTGQRVQVTGTLSGNIIYVTAIQRL